MSARWRAVRAVAMLGLAVGVALVGLGLWRRQRAAGLARDAQAVLAGRLVPRNGAPADLMAARARLLIARGEFDAAEAAIGQLPADGRKCVLLYALGNARLRQALAVFNGLPFRKVKPMIVAARYDYRLAISLAPDFWDARYNFAFASELLPVREEYQQSSGAQMSHDKAVWPDLPGAPNGMP